MSGRPVTLGSRHSGPAPAAEDGVQWLLLAYRLPAKPSSLRASVHRRLSGAGAVYLSPACAAAPLSGPAERALRRVRATITAAGGSAVLLSGRALAGGPQLAAAFNAVRDIDYADIVDGCQGAVAVLDALAAAREFRYQRLWDMDIRLKELSARFRETRGRDLLGARQADAAAGALAGYRAALDEYARRVYAADSRS